MKPLMVQPPVRVGLITAATDLVLDEAPVFSPSATPLKSIQIVSDSQTDPLSTGAGMQRVRGSSGECFMQDLIQSGHGSQAHLPSFSSCRQ